VTSTPKLINDLVECAAPVRRLRPPLARACMWLGFAGLIVVLLAIWRGPRPDLTLRLGDPVFVIGIAAALATGIFAAIAAFAISLPDRSRWWLVLPVPPLTAWLATISYGCLTDWISIGPDGIHPGESVQCLGILILTSVPLSIGLAAMLRYAALASRRRGDDGGARGRGPLVGRALAAARSQRNRDGSRGESRLGGADHRRRQRIRPRHLPVGGAPASTLASRWRLAASVIAGRAAPILYQFQIKLRRRQRSPA
jgi:hypothetical protein